MRPSMLGLRAGARSGPGEGAREAMARRSSRVSPHAIRAVIEFYPLQPTASRQGARWEILDASEPRTKLIRAELRSAHGIYIFYNSQYRAIYLGKANRRTLWGELKSSFNRNRKAQTVWRVRHPRTGENFRAAYDQRRRIRRRKVFLHEIAVYVSAYEVGDGLIDNLEALLMRAFPNELTNARMETIKYDET